ncbi:MAG TPA: histidine kinase N-terminal 7TM domain-containing protein [Solirubrobacteraceae bacterium]
MAMTGFNARQAGAKLISPTTASVVGAISLLALAGELVTFLVAPAVTGSFSNVTGGDVVADELGTLIFTLAFTGVGFIVARRQPRNPMGWLLMGVAVSVNVGTVGPTYAYLAYGPDRGSLPLGWIGVLLSGVWVMLFMFLPLAVLLFPDGKLSSRWRWPMRYYLTLTALFLVAALVTAVRDLRLRLPVDAQGNLAGLDHPHGVLGVLFGASLVTAFTFSILAIGRQARNYRRAGDERRQQLKWLTAGAIVCLASGGVAIANPSGIVADLLVPIGFALLPLAMGVGILRYRLYEIDRLVSRTLSYAVLTALLVGTFIGLIALTTDALALSGRLGVAASTLAAAALFNPLRRRVQRVVDRRFNRARYDAEATVAAFTARLRDAVEIDAIRADLLATVNRAVNPAHASVWIKR